jgi:hypothetical protein
MSNRETSTSIRLEFRMASIALAEKSVVALKNCLREEFPDAKSSHITEALAYSLGFRTHASLRAALDKPEPDPAFVLLGTEQMLARLRELGYSPDATFDFELLTKRVPSLVSTTPESAYNITYNTERGKAWRNLMVCAINAALERRLFTLRPGDNRFPDNMRRGELFDFTLPNGLPARGSVSDAGFDELAVHAAVNPKGEWVRTWNGGFTAGDAFGTTWVERRLGAWMQTSVTSFRCRKALLSSLAALDVRPMGYGDRGHVIM